jgi:hypothetical protein
MNSSQLKKIDKVQPMQQTKRSVHFLIIFEYN